MGIFRSRTSGSRERGPVLRARLESGATYEDPSEDMLFELIGDMESGDEAFLVVERTSDPSQQTYAQCAPTTDGRYVVEYRDGGPLHHYVTEAPDMRAAHELMTGWAFELPNWQAGSGWTRTSMPDRAGRVPLHYAALEDDVEQVRTAIADGQDPDVADAAGFTPLHFASQQLSIGAVRVLLAAGAGTSTVNSFGNTALHVAVANARDTDEGGDIIRLLLAAGADPDLANNTGVSPRGLAHKIANFDVARHFA